jgi:prevent-host-death family protein
MASVTIHKAKTELSKLIARVEAGEEIIIMRRDKPVARLVVANDKQARKGRIAGTMPELAAIPDDFFFKPLDEEDLKLWEGRE